MKLNPIHNMSAGLLALLLCATSVRAQNSQVRAQDSSETESKATSGCTNADALVDQAGEVTRKLTEITPAKLAQAALLSDPDHLVDTLRDLKARAELLRLKLMSCFAEEVNKHGDAIGALLKPTLKSRMIEIMLNYLNYAYETRFTDGDKSYFANKMPTDMEQKIPECKGVPELLPKVSDFISQHNGDGALNRIMPRDVISYQDVNSK